MRTFCISCDPERQRRTSEHLREHGLEVIWWRGIDGARWGLRTMLEHEPGVRLKAPMIGCLLSHYTLWQHLLYAGIDEALILEDDVCLCEDFRERFQGQYTRLTPDMDFAYVGYQERPGEAIPFGTFCYLLRRSGIPYLLDHLGQASSPVDCQLIAHLGALSHAVFRPSLAMDRSCMLGEWRGVNAPIRS